MKKYTLVTLTLFFSVVNMAFLSIPEAFNPFTATVVIFTAFAAGFTANGDL